MDWRDAERTYTDEVIGDDTLARMFERSAERNRNRPAQQYKGGVYDRTLTSTVLPAAPDGEFRAISYAEMRRIVHHLATGLRELGLETGDRVGIFSHTRMEWAQSDFAILGAGGVVTTVYASSSNRQVEYLLGDPEAVGVVVENQAMLEQVLAVEDALDLKFVVVIDEVDAEYLERALVHTLAEVHDRGSDIYHPEEYASWLDAREPTDLASLIYTSGTTGQPKGVQLTHRNFRSNVNMTRARFGPRPDKGDLPVIDEHTQSVSFLPLAHVFERLSGHFLMFASGACVAYAESPDTLREDFRKVRPTTGTSVPRVYEKIYDTIRSQAESSDLKKRIFEWATDVGREYYRTAEPGLDLRAKKLVADRLVFDTVKDALGGRIDFLISGGGSLSPELCELYHGMGLPILEGYGLTETSPVIAVNPPEAPEIGTLGPPLPGVEVAVDPSDIAQDRFLDAEGEVGELLVRGPNVTDGYWNRPDETADAFTDDVPASDVHGESEQRSGESEQSSARGWFRTGDVVEILPNDYLRFRGRAKQLIVLSTGKNVAPGPIEDEFASSPVVEQLMVLGSGQKFISALVVPSFEGLEEWADREGLDLPGSHEAICRDERVRERVQAEIDRVNENYEHHEQIKQFRLVPEPFSEGNDLLTPTMKKRRQNILEHFAEEIEFIYDE